MAKTNMLTKKKKKKNKKKNSGLYNYDASLNKLKTVFEDKMFYLSRGSIAADVRERYMDMNFLVLRNMVQRLSIVNMCVNCREQQATPFLEPAREVGSPGFVVCKKGKFDSLLKHDDKRATEIMEMIQQTGFTYDGKREDDFIDFGKMFIREVLTIDQVAIELQRNRRGEVSAFWLLDGATIVRCFEDGYEGNKKIQFVQEVDGQIVAGYSREDIIFDYMFKRADMRHRGYGYSLLEQAVDLVTTLILGVSYNRDLFIKDKVPKGFIALQGEADAEAIEAVSRYWYMAMSGSGARFTIPIIPSGKEGVNMDFKTLGQSNRDMEYHKLMLFFLSLFAGVFGIDLAELGIKTDNTQQSLGENTAGRIEYSKSRGLKTTLGFLRGVMNKITRKIDSDYEFHFVGIEPEDEMKKYETQTKAIGATRTINEMREAEGLEKLEGEEYDSVLNPQLIQLKQQLAGAEMEEQMEAEEGEEEGQMEGAEPNETSPGEEDFEEPKPTDVEEETLKSLNEHIEELRKSGYDVEVDL